MKRYAEFGPTLLRVSLGIIFIAHSLYLKIFVFTMAGTVGFFESLGLPGLSAYVVVTIEAIGGTFLLLGYRVREAAAGLAIVALGATWAHSDAGWLFTNQGGGWEYPLFLSIACLTQFLLGAGALSISNITRTEQITYA